MKKFEPGKIVTTCGVAARMESDIGFRAFVGSSLERHLNGDWGELCDDDAKLNVDALENGERLCSVYLIDGVPDGKIWIITEADRSTTTVLFPHEY